MSIEKSKKIGKTMQINSYALKKVINDYRADSPGATTLVVLVIIELLERPQPPSIADLCVAVASQSWLTSVSNTVHRLQKLGYVEIIENNPASENVKKAVNARALKDALTAR